MRKYTDQEIIQGLKTGESFAVKYLVREFLPVIRYFISKNNGNDEDAKDIFQDALYIIIEKVYKMREDEGYCHQCSHPTCKGCCECGSGGLCK